MISPTKKRQSISKLPLFFIYIVSHSCRRRLGSRCAVCQSVHRWRFSKRVLLHIATKLSCATRRYILRCKIAVQRWMPFARKLWIFGRQIVEPWQHLSIRTIRTSCPPLCATGYHGLIGMSLGTLPPDSGIARHHDLIRCEIAVQRWMPFLCKFWHRRCQIIFSGCHLLALAHWATCTGQNRACSLSPATHALSHNATRL